MNGEQMGFLAEEFADRTLDRMRVSLPPLDDRQRDVLMAALALAWLEGFGRGQKQTQAIVDRTFSQAIEKIRATALPKTGA